MVRFWGIGLREKLRSPSLTSERPNTDGAIIRILPSANVHRDFAQAEIGSREVLTAAEGVGAHLAVANPVPPMRSRGGLPVEASLGGPNLRQTSKRSSDKRNGQFKR
jgi:hypothetical protein